MPDEILASIRFSKKAKTDVALFGILAIFVIIIAAVNFGIVSNIIKDRIASAATDDIGTELSNAIKEKVANTIKQATKEANQQQSTATTTTTKQTSTGKSTSVTCNNGKCITCTDGNCTSKVNQQQRQQSTSTTCNNGNCVTMKCIDTKCTIIQNGASRSSNSAPSNAPSIAVGEPFYQQNDRTVSQKAVVVNGMNASEVSFSGTGVANGINFTDTGKALIIPRSGGATYIQGNAVIMSSDSSEKATYAFQEIGHLDPNDGMIKANGAAFFGSNATGKLAFLSNIVAIYQDQIDKAGNSNLRAWEWKGQ